MDRIEILIIDDDTKLNSLLGEYFSRFGFFSQAETDPASALKLLKKYRPHIIILDIMLPGMDGFEVCREIRKEYDIPIIMLTARGEVADRVVGLELGADDYMPKPFEPRELVARIQSVLRRQGNKDAGEREIFGELEMNYNSYTARMKGEEVELTTMEFEILSILTKNAGSVLDRDTIFEKIKGLDADSFDRSIDVMVSRLRQKLGDDPRKPKYLKTVWGKGYKFMRQDDNEK
jgi:DNA-binding response OmpR family regulator